MPVFVFVLTKLLFVSFLIHRMGDMVFSSGGRFLYSLEDLTEKMEFKVDANKKFKLPNEEGNELEVLYKIRSTGKINAKKLFDFVHSSQTENKPQSEMNMVDMLVKWINRNGKELVKGALLIKEPLREEKEGLNQVQKKETQKPIQEEKPKKRKLFDVYRGYSLTVRPQWKVRLVTDLVGFVE